mmetsp:Transcript_5747/g.17562  ORF Transcript_5747/g.17562 Transcript_5747/m.17562 type:complete len:349 (-) Transcript_5747:303-1349(-)
MKSISSTSDAASAISCSDVLRGASSPSHRSSSKSTNDEESDSTREIPWRSSAGERSSCGDLDGVEGVVTGSTSLMSAGPESQVGSLLCGGGGVRVGPSSAAADAGGAAVGGDAGHGACSCSAAAPRAVPPVSVAMSDGGSAVGGGIRCPPCLPDAGVEVPDARSPPSASDSTGVPSSCGVPLPLPCLPLPPLLPPAITSASLPPPSPPPSNSSSANSSGLGTPTRRYPTSSMFSYSSAASPHDGALGGSFAAIAVGAPLPLLLRGAGSPRFFFALLRCATVVIAGVEVGVPPKAAPWPGTAPAAGAVDTESSCRVDADVAGAVPTPLVPANSPLPSDDCSAVLLLRER